MDAEQTRAFREKVQLVWWWVIEEAHFEVLDEEAEIWFAWMHTPEEPDQSFPVIACGIATRTYVRITDTALFNLMGGTA